MNHQNQQRAAVHHRKGVLARQLKDDKDDDDVKKPIVIIRPTAAATTIARVLPVTTTTARVIVRPTTTATSIARVTNTPVVVPPRVTTTSASAIASSTSALVRPVTTTSPIIAAKPIITSSSIPPSVTSTPIQTGARSLAPAISTASSSAASATSTVAASSGVSTGALVGGIGGGIVGVAAVGFLVVLFIRRWRKKSADNAGFSATKFRRSALLLDDDKSMRSGPRPPSMIERRAVQPAIAPTAPSAPYPYDQSSDHGHYGGSSPYDVPTQHGGAGQFGPASQFGAATQFVGQNQHVASGPGRYGAPNPYGAPTAPYNGHPQYNQFSAQDPGYGAAGAYGQHTAYAAVGPYGEPQILRYPQQQQQYPRVQTQQYSFTPGQVVRSPQQPRQQDSLPNPFTASPSPEHYHAQLAASPPPRNPSPQEQAQPTTFLRRQNTQAGGAPPAYEDNGRYTDMQRDVKHKPLAVSNADDSGPSAAASSSTAPAVTPTSHNVALTSPPAVSRRPTSSYTLYDPDDAYGGI